MKFIVFCLLSITVAQPQNPGTPESCNVVCNCNSGHLPSSRTEDDHLPKLQGPPGKTGVKGDIGPSGIKGRKGETGSKGQKGNNADGVLISSILGALSAESCEDLKVKYQVKTSGYYLVRDPRKSTPAYVYCDFFQYRGVSNCSDLTEKYNVTNEGYYLFGTTSVQLGRFQFCSPIFSGIYTCQRLQERYAANESGFYRLQTPNSLPFRVYCDFATNPVVTEVHHNIMGEREADTKCSPAGCYTVRPDYGATGIDLANMVDNSQNCRQFIKLKCRGVTLSGQAWWMSRNREKMPNWGGSSGNKVCACGETNSCIVNSKQCNCDQNSDAFVTSDEGYLTDKSKLPLSELKLGDLDGVAEEGWYTIGKLECSG